MGDIIMTAGIYVFAVLFIFLLFVFFSAVIGYFVQPKYRKYQPDVTVLIPAYNEEKNIGKCLEHVFASHYPLSKMDVIVVDDGSADNTRSIVKQFQKKYPRKIRLVNGTHQGKSVSLNHGVKIARTEIIMTIDADTFIDPGSLRLLVQPFQDPLVGATNGSCVVANPHSLVGVFQRIEYHYNNLIRKSFSSLFKTGIWFFGAFACYRRSVIEKIGYFKTDTLTEDMDTAMEIYLSGYRTINVWDALGHTVAPDTLSAFFKQRTRWWMGVLQSLAKNRALFHYKS
ncbi:MAG: glycosyltransferase, partial [Candidatus Woesearchaeota archaeon]